MPSLGPGPTNRAIRWPPQCCVPAFLGSSVAAFYDRLDILGQEETRRRLAEITNVVLAPADDNPWNLPVSPNDSDWGVTRRKAAASFTSVQQFIGRRAELTLDFVDANTIAYEMYEDAVAEFMQGPAIVGIAFDFYPLSVSNSHSKAIHPSKADHVVRLTPLGDERDHQPNILSDEFQFDYSGDLHVFDDSGEMMGKQSLVNWRSLMRACRDIDGSFWVIRRGVS
jgi:hypothetical protein